ncbi:MAG: protein-export chaperone SecB [Gammaproteobacteria bacterium]|nr:protein-export chaperone SecB [Gammaproteobacteria bacterium]
MAAENTEPQTAQAPMGQLGIQKIYVKDLSFEAPNSPAVFAEQLNPTLDLHFGNATSLLAPDVHEVVLTVTATVKLGEKVIYLIEVKQAGIFNITGFHAQHMPMILATAGPNILFPFAREAICDVVTKGGFPQLLIAPVNFEMLYAQEVQRRRAASSGEKIAH